VSFLKANLQRVFTPVRPVLPGFKKYKYLHSVDVFLYYMMQKKLYDFT